MARLQFSVVALLASALVLCGCAAPDPGPTRAPEPLPSETVAGPSTPPIREQLTVDFPRFIPLPEGTLEQEQATPVRNGTYWHLRIDTASTFEQVVEPLIAAGELTHITYGDGIGPGLADGSGAATVFIGGLQVSLSVWNTESSLGHWAMYTVQPVVSAQTEIKPWPAVGGETVDWTTAPKTVPPAEFPQDLPLPERPPFASLRAEQGMIEVSGVMGAEASWLTRDEFEVEGLLESWLASGWDLENRTNQLGVIATVRKGDVQARIHFLATKYFNAWQLRIIVWDFSS